MNNTKRNLTLAAAALAALTGIAPEASARDRGHGRGAETPRQENRHARGPERREFRGHESRGDERRETRGNAYRGPGRYAYAPPLRYGYYAHRAGHAVPFRIFSGFRFFAACPGPGYVYIANYGWVLPPFFGAVWIPGHYDIGGYWVDGFWR